MTKKWKVWAKRLHTKLSKEYDGNFDSKIEYSGGDDEDYETKVDEILPRIKFWHRGYKITVWKL